MNRRGFLLSTAAFAGCSFIGDQPYVTKYAGDEVYLERLSGIPKTLICHVHAWSSVYTEVSTWPQYKSLNDVCIVGPNFGGQNNQPEGAGHPKQLERIKRVIDKAVADHGCQRVILSGYSGGMFASLMAMAAYPGIAYGAVLWNGPTDLAAWWNENSNHRGEIESCLGGTPTQLPAQYLSRSPVSVASAITGLHLRINYGGQDVEVLPHHSTDVITALQVANDVQGIQFTGGHVFLADTAMSQLQTMIL